MKTLNQYIKEHLDKGDRVCSIVTFKDNMMKASEIKEGLLSVFKDTERDWNQDWYDNIKFQAEHVVVFPAEVFQVCDQ